MTKGEQFTKRVAFKEADDERQIATGVVMVPDKVDLQGDYEQAETIRNFAEGFMQRLSAGEAEGGVMHAVFPDHSSLIENAVLDEAREIGGKEFPAGTWTQSWKFEDNELWTLVRDDILSGYSIGAQDVRWSEPMVQDDLPDDVAVASGYPDDEPVWELQEGTIVEVSAVDIPAVPDAEILATKADVDKRVADHLGDREGFLEEMAERGHSEGEAERLWSYLQRAVDGEDAEADAPSSVLQRVGKAALSALSGSGSDDGSEVLDSDRRSEKDVDDFEADIFRVVAPEDEAENYEDEVLGIGVDFPNSDVYVDWRNEVFPDQLDESHVSIYGSINDLEQATGNTTEQMDTLNAKAAKALFGESGLQVNPTTKESRTLSAANRRRAMAAHDAMEDLLRSEVDFEMNRFTDDDAVDFDIGEFGKAAPTTGDDGTDAGGKDAADSMTDKNDDEPPEWAKTLQEQIEKNNERLDDLTSDGEKEADADGDADADADKDVDEPPAWAKEIQEQTEKNAEQIEAVAKASGSSQQLDANEDVEANREYSKQWDNTLGLPTEGDA